MRREQGFSLMEMMVVLLIIAIVVAASAPMVSKKISDNSISIMGADCLWRIKNDDRNSISHNSKPDNNKSVIIGATQTNEAKDSKNKSRLFIKTGNGEDATQTTPQIALADGDEGEEVSVGYLINSYFSHWFSSNKPTSADTNSVAIGHNSKAKKESVSLGSESEASENSVAVGYNTKAIGVNSIVLGSRPEDDTVSGEKSVAVGYKAQAKGINASALGYNAIAEGNYSTALGKSVKAVGENSVAIGCKMEESDYSDVAEGEKPTIEENEVVAGGNSSIAIGYNTGTNADYSIAIGNLAKTYMTLGSSTGNMSLGSPHSIAIGNKVVANGEGSIVIGKNIFTLGSPRSIAIGSRITVNFGDSAIAIGKSIYAQGDNSVAIGTDPSEENDDEATDATAKATAFSDGTVAIGTNVRAYMTNAIAIGCGKNPIAIGRNTQATGVGSIAIGSSYGNVNNVYTKAGGNYSTAIGCGAQATSEGSIAIGSSVEENKAYTKASGNYSTAIGYNAQATSDFNTAIGYGAKGNVEKIPDICEGVDNVIVLGDENTTVYIPGDLVVDKVAILGQEEGYVPAIQVHKISIPRRYQLVRLKKYDDSGRLGFSSVGYNSSSFPTIKGLYPSDIPYDQSDRRLKNVGEVFKGGLEEIKKLEVFNYVYKKDKNKTPRVGVMAQDLQKIFPNAVFKGDDGFLRIRMEDMFYALINAVKELKNKIDLLAEKQNKVDESEKRVDRLEERLSKLEVFFEEE